MFYFIPTIILRHKKENLKKCSLRGLETRKDMLFLTYPQQKVPPAENLCILSLNAPVLTDKDQDFTLCLVDGTWRYANIMQQTLPSHPSYIYRSLPSCIRTAYPRKQNDCSDPERGLASIEALFTAYMLLNRNTEGLLDHYYWKDLFLQKNQSFFSSFQPFDPC